jgi:hypothetical protein
MPTARALGVHREDKARQGWGLSFRVNLERSAEGTELAHRDCDG